MDRPLEEEWRDIELYERVRVRQNRNRFLILFFAVALFFSLCAVPVVRERLPKWKSLRAAREISTQIEHMKTLVIREKKPIRMVFLPDGRLQLELLDHCASGNRIRELETMEWPNSEGELKVLTEEDARGFNLKLALDHICFDPVFGLDEVKSNRVIVIAPVNDLADQRLDRASYVILEGESAKISIN